MRTEHQDSLERLERLEMNSPLGAIDVMLRNDKVSGLEFADHRERLEGFMRRQFPNASIHKVRRATGTMRQVRAQIIAYFGGDIDALERIEVDLAGTRFQLQVWQQLRRIRPGTTVSYGQLARRVRRPKAARAVGAANGRNPIALIVPCHRAIGSNGALTGYAGGLDRKRWLLDHESRD